MLDELKTYLIACTHPELKNLADGSGVPYHTLLKIRSGETDNPRIRTVCAAMRFIEASKKLKRKAQKNA